MKRQVINTPATQPMYDQFHFPAATRVGDTIWVSGVTGADPETGRPARGMEAQARIAFETLKTNLEAAGAGMEDIVDLVTFHTDLRRDMRDFMKVKDAFIPADFPSWTAVGVTQLAIDGYLVEVRAVAVAGSGR